MFKKLALIIILFVPFIVMAKTPIKVTFVYDDGVPIKIIAEGAVSTTQWLGVSFYSAEYKDAITEGHHIVREIKAGTFNEEITLDSLIAPHYNSSYEIALWGKKVDKKDCKIENDYWCKMRGFHLENLLFYQTGYFNTLKNGK